MIRLGLRRTVVAATASLAVILPVSAPVAANPTTPATPRVEGADLVSLSVDSGGLRMSFRDAAQLGERAGGADPRTLRFAAQGGPIGVVPDDPAFAFLGKPGTPVWSLGEHGSRFPALDTTAIAPAEVTGGAVTLDLVSVDGPGSFAAYTLSPWGRPTLLLDSDDRRTARLTAGRRVGGLVWMFDAAGEYRVTLRATARAGSRTLSDEAAYAVSVAGSPPAPGPVTTGGTAPAATRGTAPAAGTGRRVAALATPSRRSGTPAPEAAARTAAAGRKVISDGHVDMGPQLSGGTLTIRLKDDATTPPTWRELADVVLKVTDKARISVPSGPGYAFLGTAGDQVYLLPQSQQPGIVWPGWNTQHPSVVGGTRGNVTWRLRKVDGPGAVKLFLTGSFGNPEVVFDSARALPQQLGIPPNTHAHGNWAFTKAGRYRLTVEMTATTTAGKTVSDTRTLTLAVGDATDAGGADGGQGSGSGAGSNAGTDSPGGPLAKTGANVMSVAAGGALLLAAGTVAVLLTRRRRGGHEDFSTPDAS